MTIVLQTTFQIIFFNDTKSIEICSLGSNWQYASIGSDNGLAPTRRQAFIWSNDDRIDRRIYASPGLNDVAKVKNNRSTITLHYLSLCWKYTRDRCLSQQRLGNAEMCPCQYVTMVSRFILIASMHCPAEVVPDKFRFLSAISTSCL